MGRLLLTSLLLTNLLFMGAAKAQEDTGAEESESTENTTEDSSNEAAAEEAVADDDAEAASASGADEASTDAAATTGRLRAPELSAIGMPDVGDRSDEEAERSDAGDVPVEDELLASSSPAPSARRQVRWSGPEIGFSLDGYLRVRGEIQDTFDLGRSPTTLNPDRDLPFSRFWPTERGAVPAGGCGESPDLDTPSACSSDQLRSANMRLRLEPSITVNDDIAVHMTMDVFDNMVLGSTPDGSVWIPPGGPGGSGDGFVSPERTPGVPLDSFSSTSNPPEGLRNGLRDSIRVRRAWAEVTNRSIGRLQFGRMASNWGLGLLANRGEGLDDDFSSDVDRIVGVTKLAGFYLAAAWDFPGEGFITDTVTDLNEVPFDATQSDDIDQYVFAAWRRMEAEEQRERLESGDWVLNGGLYFVYRNQLLSSAGVSDPFANATTAGSLLSRRNAEAFIPDAWVQFLWGNLRVELEAVMIAGSIESIQNGEGYQQDDYSILQFGGALEAEYRLLDDRLGISFHAGYASGDPDVDGLSSRVGLLPQNDVGTRRQDRTISTLQFHPNYRVDLILWRQIMGRVAGAYYLRPGVSYDLISTPFGQTLGGKVELIYSRASQETQTYGSDPNLGVELDVSIYYGDERGSASADGFYGMLQYGILFPMDGLGYPEFDGRTVDTVSGSTELSTAWTLRMLMGVRF